MKYLLSIFMLLTVILSFSTAHFWRESVDKNRSFLATVDTLATRDKKIDILQAELEKPITSELIFYAKDKRTKDFFMFMKIKGKGREGYAYVTDLKGMDREAFDNWLQVAVNDSGLDLYQTINNLWHESRNGTNTKHSVNKDGSRDFGWSGQNYPKGTSPHKISPYVEVYDYIRYIRKSKLESYPYHEQRERYYSARLWKLDEQKRRN